MARSEQSLVLLLGKTALVYKPFDSGSEKLHLNATFADRLRFIGEGCRHLCVIVLAGARSGVVIGVVEDHVLLHLVLLSSSVVLKTRWFGVFEASRDCSALGLLNSSRYTFDARREHARLVLLVLGSNFLDTGNFVVPGSRRHTIFIGILEIDGCISRGFISSSDCETADPPV